MTQRERAEAVVGGHLVCREDCWYSCPLSGECCNAFEDPNTCTCGRDKLVEKVMAMAQQIRQETVEEVARAVQRLTGQDSSSWNRAIVYAVEAIRQIGEERTT